MSQWKSAVAVLIAAITYTLLFPSIASAQEHLEVIGIGGVYSGNEVQNGWIKYFISLPNKPHRQPEWHKISPVAPDGVTNIVTIAVVAYYANKLVYARLNGPGEIIAIQTLNN
jgi:hypothetical protein